MSESKNKDVDLNLVATFDPRPREILEEIKQFCIEFTEQEEKLLKMNFRMEQKQKIGRPKGKGKFYEFVYVLSYLKNCRTPIQLKEIVHVHTNGKEVKLEYIYFVKKDDKPRSQLETIWPLPEKEFATKFNAHRGKCAESVRLRTRSCVLGLDSD